MPRRRQLHERRRQLHNPMRGSAPNHMRCGLSCPTAAPHLLPRRVAGGPCGRRERRPLQQSYKVGQCSTTAAAGLRRRHEHKLACSRRLDGCPHDCFIRAVHPECSRPRKIGVYEWGRPRCPRRQERMGAPATAWSNAKICARPWVPTVGGAAVRSPCGS